MGMANSIPIFGNRNASGKFHSRLSVRELEAGIPGNSRDQEFPLMVAFSNDNVNICVIWSLVTIFTELLTQDFVTKRFLDAMTYPSTISCQCNGSVSHSASHFGLWEREREMANSIPIFGSGNVNVNGKFHSHFRERECK